MKNLITILTALTITFSTVFASTTPEVIISTDEIEVVSIGTLDIFSDAGFNTESESLTFTTTNDMTVVQIYNGEGEMEFQLPVMSNNVVINKNLFGAGAYKLGFILEGQTAVHLTDVKIK